MYWWCNVFDAVYMDFSMAFDRVHWITSNKGLDMYINTLKMDVGGNAS